MSIKKSIVVPVMILASAIFAVALAVSGTIIFASNRSNAQVSEALEITLKTQQLSTQTHAAQEYLNRVLDMTDFSEMATLERDVTHHSDTIRDSLKEITAHHLPKALIAQVDTLRDELANWRTLAQQRLGLTGLAQIPTRSTLDQQAHTVIGATADLAAAAADFAEMEIKRAHLRTLRIFAVSMACTMAILALALVFAFKRASQMSHAVLRISSRVLGLARVEGDPEEQPENELEAVHGALDKLHESLREKRRIQTTLIEEKTRAEAATESKSRFLATMSHEIRTPINGVLGMADILNETELTAEQRSYSETILASSEALLRIVNDILDFSKLEAGKTLLLQQPFDLRDVLFDVATLVSSTATAKGVEVAIDLPDDTPRHFIGDSGRIRQVLLNIIGNAVKFTPQGYVGITLSYDPNRPEPLSIAIEDTGVGIPQNQIDHIFQAFEQVESTVARRFEGTGLGLAITARLVDAMEGRIDVTSTVDVGSCFTLHLPLAIAALEDSPNPGRQAQIEQIAGKSILLVSNLPFAATLRQNLLKSWGAEVQQFIDCTSALASNTAQTCDLVLVETLLETKEAAEFARRFWALRQTDPKIPILLTTDGHHITALQSLKSQGPIAALMRPARNGVLLQTLAQALCPKTDLVAPPPNQKPQQADLSAYRVLVAEDNRTNQLVLRKMLAPTGLDMTFCNDGQEAVDTFRTSQFDLVLMDMSMPVMDGVQATRMIRKLEQDMGLIPCPILALTANVMDTDEAACRAAGMVDFLTKPVRKQVVIAAIEKWGSPRQNHPKVGNL